MERAGRTVTEVETGTEAAWGWDKLCSFKRKNFAEADRHSRFCTADAIRKFHRIAGVFHAYGYQNFCRYGERSLDAGREAMERRAKDLHRCHRMPYRGRLRTGLAFGLALLATGGAAAQAAANVPAPILTLQLPPLQGEGLPRINAGAAAAFQRGVRALHRGKGARAEHEARRALRLDPDFAEAWSLAATASLAQRDFGKAAQQAATAARLAPGDATPWILLATAENHRGQYADAAGALEHVQFAGDEPWQADYQEARAAAGMGRGAEVLTWTDRAALAAPATFAPLHLLRASALAAQGQYQIAADELEDYLRLAGIRSPQQTALRAEVARLRGLAEAQGEGGREPQ